MPMSHSIPLAVSALKLQVRAATSSRHALAGDCGGCCQQC